ncbi:MAG: LPS translocon maturation chaperone LptM [Enterovibrio sp.]
MQKKVILCALLIALAGCGQRGGLYFPNDAEVTEKSVEATVQQAAEL